MRVADLPFVLPPVTPGGPVPRWTGHGFADGDRLVPVLEYGRNLDGWTDDLTDLHERTAGDTHPIDRASRHDALAQLRSRLQTPSPVVLEVGCSSGYLMRELVEALPGATIIGADVVSAPLQRLSRDLPGIPLLRFDLQTCPLPTASVDAVVMLNVFEHIADDGAAARQVHRILKPGGVAVIEVPAGPHLFDDYDRALKHFRRYRMRDLVAMLQQAGFRVVRQSHLGFLIYPPFAWSKRRNRRQIRADAALHEHVSDQVSRTGSSRVMDLMLRIEGALGQLVRYPTGIRCLVVGERA
jgi:SAM-dependent methyltransferase